MRTTCLINNYNYRQYLLDALDSALRQTVPFDELILVDDGSTDGSVDAVLAAYANEPKLQVIAKENEGQLSCFNAGWSVCTGNIVFFLDADDTYEPTYVEETLRVFQINPHVDFVFTALREFGAAATRLEKVNLPDRNLGCSLIPTLFTGQWIGAPTSCLSMRRDLLAKILPVPWLEDWRIRATIAWYWVRPSPAAPSIVRERFWSTIACMAATALWVSLKARWLNTNIGSRSTA